MYKASSILFALKKIQANETKINVMATSENLFKNVFCFIRKLDIIFFGFERINAVTKYVP